MEGPTRRFVSLTGVVLAGALILAACQAAPASTPASQAPGTQPAATLTPTAPPGQTPAPEPTSGGGGGGLTLPEGAWSGGTARAVVTGDFGATFDASLLAATSLSTTESTLLQYVSAASQSFALAIYQDYVAVSITTAEFVGGGGSTADAPCDATFARSDANAVEGTVTCRDAPVVGMSGAAGQTIDLEVSFTATR